MSEQMQVAINNLVEAVITALVDKIDTQQVADKLSTTRNIDLISKAVVANFADEVDAGDIEERAAEAVAENVDSSEVVERAAELYTDQNNIDEEDLCRAIAQEHSFDVDEKALAPHLVLDYNRLGEAVAKSLDYKKLACALVESMRHDTQATA